MTAAPRVTLRARERTLRLGERPLLMGIVNATPDSFSDPGYLRGPDDALRRAIELAEAGAEIIDVGGESAAVHRPAVAPGEEIARVVPVVERIVSHLDVLVSVDTYKPAVAAAAVAAGASVVNDISGLADPELADVCAHTGAALVLMHTRAGPKEKVLDHPYGDVGADFATFLRERLELAAAHGVEAERTILDPGPDFGKSPSQTVEALRALAGLHELGRPVLLAVSRKDFVGAVVRRRPRERLAGTLAAVGHGLDAGAHILRVHDVGEAADFLAVRAVLRGERDLAPAARVPDELRREAR
ncbi:MAG: dihydropteroate synthase [Solirubrobacteraceae bacterium]